MSGDAGGLFNFTQLPRAVQGMIPNGGPDAQRGEHEVRVRTTGGNVHLSRGRPRTHGCVDRQLLILRRVRLMVVWTGSPIGKYFMTKVLKIQFAFPFRAEDAFLMCLAQDGKCTASAAYTLIGCDFGDVD